MKTDARARLRELATRRPTSRWGAVLVDVAKRWSDCRGNRLAASITFYGLLSIFPALLLFVSLIGFLPDSVTSEAENTVTTGVREIFTSSADTLVENVEKLFRRQSSGLLTFSTLFALWSVSSAFHALIDSLNRIGEVDDPRPWLAVRARAVALGFGTVLVFAAAILAVVQLDVFGGTIATVGVVFWGGTVYVLALPPGERTQIVWPGALASTILLLLLAGGFGIYLTVAAAAGSITATIGGGLAVVLWLWLVVGS
jgi:membrane protein